MKDSLIKAYIRGHFDGDGSIGYSYLKRKTKEAVPIGNIAIVSTKSFIINLIKYINDNIKIKMGFKLHSNKTHAYATLGGSLNILKFMDWLYYDATIYLQRKFAKYDEFKSIYIQYKNSLLNNRKIVQLSLNNDYIQTFDNKEIASKVLNLHPLSIYNVCTGRAKTAGKFIFCFKRNYNN